MKIIKKCVPLAIAATCLFSISPVGSLNINQVKAAEQEQNLSKYSGEEIFKGVIFGQGELSENFADMWDPKILKVMSSKESQEAVNVLISQFKEQNPEYFTKLEQAVQQKNPKKVDKLLEEGSTALMEIAKKNGRIVENDKQEVCGPTVCALALVTYGVAFHAAAVVTTAAVVATIYWKVSIQSAPEFLDPSLSKEEIQQKREDNIANIFKRIS
ncbi:MULTISPECIES: sporulation delaying protein family toxin [Bacillus]|uniref:sporulation delaying protein family toxin n=1 Tax=Bacillus TaxID=1386 RepID=UPI001879505A|nr:MULTISPECIES: sporulation delaying protein family toxin [Bacillus cereus group]MBE7135330.1 sporulation delaying protein family toxin [Bacillus paranthracis]MBE7151919.1 sporulation delaying protein family toxin [Bacillus paranthracis]MCC2375560.1 sporulation delaying protein family toxin [Bacillus paranthracis]MCX3322844.1 sporulation delaying protein family toxin [Bacillus paranthracis]MDA1745572.1 sporulation delaying protein family toxin [Bacillus cereus group sp. LD121LC]